MTFKQSKIYVAYVDHMGNDNSVLNAARQSFGRSKMKPRDEPLTKGDIGLLNFLASGKRSGDWELYIDDIVQLAVKSEQAYVKGMDDMRDACRAQIKDKLLDVQRIAQHWAPFAHPHISLEMDIPIFLARQLVKHQIGFVWSEESRRYTDSDVSFYIEPVWNIRPDSDIKQGAGDQFDQSMQIFVSEAVIESATEASKLYNFLVNREGTVKLAPEQAREILTLNMMTSVCWTGSLLSYARMFNARYDNHAQGAAKIFAMQASDIIRPLYPHSWEALTGVNLEFKPE